MIGPASIFAKHRDAYVVQHQVAAILVLHGFCCMQNELRMAGVRAGHSKSVGGLLYFQAQFARQVVRVLVQAVACIREERRNRQQQDHAGYKYPQPQTFKSDRHN